ncbi:hypothetical protein J5N97_001353 [Dioscorea zingiberensis]|uniref:Uncharacterized protein n=1 Tax=Dioscorea zingiberensis TaxID=325984 RepID=A0A9D5H2B9_9LILI|nr:hypothetical protein J5N97_001353 [Dioscorea zingiberensis]
MASHCVVRLELADVFQGKGAVCRLKQDRDTVCDDVWMIELSGKPFFSVISLAISDAANLSKIVISGSRFDGNIPSEIDALSASYEFSASDNRLTGILPTSISSWARLRKLNVCNNSLSDKLSKGLQSWQNLSELNLANNAFLAIIPFGLHLLDLDLRPRTHDDRTKLMCTNGCFIPQYHQEQTKVINWNY